MCTFINLIYITHQLIANTILLLLYVVAMAAVMYAFSNKFKLILLKIQDTLKYFIEFPPPESLNIKFTKSSQLLILQQRESKAVAT